MKNNNVEQNISTNPKRVSKAATWKPVNEIFEADHDRLEQLFERLLEAFRANAQSELRALWNELDSGLSRHMDAEEKYAFPDFSMVDAKETEALKQEHGRLRRLLTELGVGIDLHLVREPIAREFVDLLRAHSARETGLFYRWVNSGLANRLQRALLDELGNNTAQLKAAETL